MNTMRICGKCGAPLPAATPEGLCPKCLMKAGIGTETGKTDQATAKERTAAPAPETIAKHFPQLEIIELLGQGGMGMVYRARQTQLDRFVALKILSPDLSGDPAFAERFTREARALARLNHPNIVAVYDFGKAGDSYFFIMEYVDGMSLWQMEQTQKPLGPTEALAIVPKICDALQYAHDEGIVHRDIKPGNILLDKKGRVKIADFGLAKLLGQDTVDFRLTQSKMALGTPQYMAPEQMERPLETDHRADIYSLGVVFYEMLTGELPIGRFDPPSRRVQVDVRLDEVVLRSLERDVQRRYQRASEVKTAVESISAGPFVPQPSAAPMPQAAGRKPKRLAWGTIMICAFLFLASFMPWGLTGTPRTDYKMIGPLAVGSEPVDKLVNAWDSTLCFKPPAVSRWYFHVPNWLVPITALAIVTLTLIKASGFKVPRLLIVSMAAYGVVHAIVAVHAITLGGYHDAALPLTVLLFIVLFLQTVGGWIVERVPGAVSPPTPVRARLAAAGLLLCGLTGLLPPLLSPASFGFGGPDTIASILKSLLVIIGVPAAAVIIIGALRMLVRPDSRLALASGALAMLPCYVGFPLGLPIGFWVLRLVKSFEIARTVHASESSQKPAHLEDEGPRL